MASKRVRRRNRRIKTSPKNLQTAVRMLVDLGIPLPDIAHSLRLSLTDVQRIDDETPILQPVSHHEHLINIAAHYEIFSKLTVESWERPLSITQRLIHQVLYERLQIRVTHNVLFQRLIDAEKAAHRSSPIDTTLLYEMGKDCLQICWIKIATRAIAAPMTHRAFQDLAIEQCDWLMRLERVKQNRKPHRAPGS